MKSIEFLQQYAPEGPWVLTGIQPDKKGITTATFWPDKLEELTKWLTKYIGERNLYFHVNPPTRDLDKKAQREDIKAVTYLHVDVDPRPGEELEAEQARALAILTEKLPSGVPKPTCVIFSGGGYQAFWKLREPLIIEGDLEKAEEAKRFNQQLEVVFGGDNCHNIDRIMRLPGTINLPDERKRKKGRVPIETSVVYYDEEAVYDTGEFQQAPLIQTGGGFGETEADVDVTHNIEFITDLDQLNEWDVPDRVKIIIAQGRDPDKRKPKDDSRSAWVIDVCCQLSRAGVPDQMIFAMLMDPGWGISESILENKQNAEKYAIRQIQRAKEFVEDPVLMDFNDKFAVVENIGGKVRVIEEVTDDLLKRPTLTFQTFQDFKNRNCNRAVVVGNDASGNPKTQLAGDWWLKHPKRRTYHTIVFAPGQEAKKSYNLWKGFACEGRPGDCSLFLKHVEENVCANNPEHYAYLLGWMARLVQHPDRQGEVAVVLRGGRGTGKSFFAVELGKLFGRHFLQVSNSSHLVGNFNSHLRDLILLFADEAFYANDKKHESILKTIVTEDQLTIEAKGVDVVSAPNYIHLIMASNESHVIPAGSDERRFFVLEVSEEHKQDAAYFAAIAKQQENGGREALLHYLRTYDITNFEFRNAPDTGALREQKLLSLNHDAEWWFNKLWEGRLLTDGEGWPVEVIKDELHNDYTKEMDRNKITRRGTQTSLGRFLKREIPSISVVQRRITVEEPRGDGWTQEVTKRAYMYKIPTLQTCRKLWERTHGVQDWLEIEEELL
jgi:hypothetical protein